MLFIHLLSFAESVIPIAANVQYKKIYAVAGLSTYQNAPKLMRAMHLAYQ
jgi:hypothetical protein